MSNKRETWVAQSQTNTVFTIGDLPNVPAFSRLASVDLLSFHTKEELRQSSSLVTVIQNGWLTITKTLDGNAETINSSNVLAALSTQDSYAAITKTSDYTPLLSDYVILCDASSGSFTIALSSTTRRIGKTYVIKKIDSSRNSVTIAGIGTIDGNPTLLISTPYDSVTIVSNGTDWFII